MALPRKTLVDVELTQYYHCISRCVRRAFLCGRDPLSGKNFDHRKTWLVGRLRILARVFAIEVCGYAVLSNHVHLVLRLNPDRATKWTAAEVVERWRRLFPASADAIRNCQCPERRAELITLWRARLSSISWFMRCLNEYIARRANREDNCSGRFWEGRFRSQALLDEGALLTCLAYVDLNPVRAGLANSLETSEFTSICERLNARREGKVPKWLAPFQKRRSPEQGGLPISWEDYVVLLRSTAQALLERNRESNPRFRDILERFRLNQDGFVLAVQNFSRTFFTMAGEVHRIELVSRARGCARCLGKSGARRLYRGALGVSEREVA